MFLYFPASHNVHSELLSTDTVLQALQVQLLLKTAPTPEYEFCAQVVQLIFPRFILYLPPLHKVHKPPLSPVLPALQIQAVTSLSICYKPTR